jgi:hypothetical protein
MAVVKERKPTTTRPRSLKKPVEADLGFTWGRVNSLFFGLAIASLLVGYVTLSQGSTTLSPIMLVIGYCVLIPLSLLYSGRSQGSSSGE